MACLSPNTNFRRGFTLIESLMATVVLAMTVVAISGMLVATTQNMHDSNQRIVLLDNTRQSMEVLSAFPLTTICPATTSQAMQGLMQANVSVSGSTSMARLMDNVVVPVTDNTVTTSSVQFISRAYAQPANDMAVVSITTTDSQGNTTTLKRLFTNVQIDH